jgi:HD superfamily phosphohydrolase
MMAVSSLAIKHPHIVTERDSRLIPIAALYHDIGHSAFSHTFDDITNTNHELRSQEIVERVISKYNIDVDTEDVSFIKELIHPTLDTPVTWRYQIVSNDDEKSVSVGVDVDRMDYICRDSIATGVSVALNVNSVRKLINRAYIDETTMQLIYPTAYVVDDLMTSRKHLYERVYRHKTALKIEKLLSTALKSDFMRVIGDMDAFLNISDSVLQDVYVNTKDPVIWNAIENIFTRNFKN